MKYNQKQNKQIKNAVANYNRKIKSMQKSPKYKDVILPSTTSIKEIKSKVTKASDITRELNSLNRLFKTGAGEIVTGKNGIKTIKYVSRETSIKISSINRRRTNERKKAEQADVVVSGLKTGFKRGEMYGNRLEELKPKQNKLLNARSPEEFIKFIQGVDRLFDTDFISEHKQLYMQNYMKAVDDQMGQYAPIINDMVMKFTPDEFTDMYYENQDLTIDFVYGAEYMQQKAEVIISILQDYLSA